MRPFVLPPNRFSRFYEGGARIDALRGDPPGPERTPEDWVGSTATSLGSTTEGLAHLEDGRVLKDLIEADPEGFLGPEHVARYGANPALLVKLLDAGERLPVHFHPGRAFAREHLGLPFGKTESWLIIDAEPGAQVHSGFTETAEPDTLRGWVERQDAEEMLAALKPIDVTPGDAVLVPAGTMHAIGEGILILELQEPTDLSVLVEYAKFGVTDGSEHLHLGWDTALQAADLGPSPYGAESTLPEEADAYFRAPRVKGGEALDPSFSILLVTDGEGVLASDGHELPLTRGATVLVPFGAGATALEGDVTAVRCMPPDPHAEEARW